MSPLRPTISIIVFLLVAFVIPWSTWVTLRLKHVASPEATLAFMASAAFCCVGGVVATYVAKGRSGVKDLAHRCVFYRVFFAWWLYALFLVLAMHTIATIIYGIAHGDVGPVSPIELSHQWWLFYTFLFILFQGPLAEELGWRGFLLPHLMDRYSPLGASLIVGLVWAAWHINVFFSPPASWALFIILMTVLFLHTRGSVLLAIVMRWSGLPGKYIVGTSFPAAQQPPDWLRAAVLITVAGVIAAMLGSNLSRVGPQAAKRSD